VATFPSVGELVHPEDLVGREPIIQTLCGRIENRERFYMGAALLKGPWAAGELAATGQSSEWTWHMQADLAKSRAGRRDGGKEACRRRRGL
jgi:hypothetical protein